MPQEKSFWSDFSIFLHCFPSQLSLLSISATAVILPHERDENGKVFGFVIANSSQGSRAYWTFSSSRSEFSQADLLIWLVGEPLPLLLGNGGIGRGPSMNPGNWNGGTFSWIILWFLGGWHNWRLGQWALPSTSDSSSLRPGLVAYSVIHLLRLVKLHISWSQQ